MTREEAITYLNVIWNRYKAEYEIERETLDAYHMAIEALSADAVHIHNDGTLEVKVPNAQKVGRVLVMDTDSHIGGGLFYPADAENETCDSCKYFKTSYEEYPCADCTFGNSYYESTEAKTPDYMQQSRQADMMLVDLNSKDGYLLDGKYKVNGCVDLTDGRVSVVRCKDCRHAYYADNRVPHEKTWVCERFMNEEITSNDYCSWGERREK